MGELRTELTEDMGELRTELTGEMSEFQSEVDGEITELTNKVQLENGKVVLPFLGAIGAFDDTGTMNGGYAVGNMLYQYRANGATGNFKSINMQTGAMNAFGGTELRYYHGNDFTVKNNVLYCAPYDDGNGNGVNRIITGTIDGTSVTGELDVFSDTGLNCLFAISDYEGDELLCALRPYGTDNVNATRLFAYNVSTGSKREITVDWGDFDYSVNSFPHPMIYIDGLLYLTASFENGVYTIFIDGDTAKVINYCGLNRVNSNNCPVHEIESICTVDRFGENIIVIGSTSTTGFVYSGLSIRGTNPNNLIDATTTTLDYYRTLYYDPSGTNLFEVGTQAYPCKKFARTMYLAHGVKTHTVADRVNVKMPASTDEAINLFNENVSLNGPCTYNAQVDITRSTVSFGGVNIFENRVVVNRNSMAVFPEQTTFNGRFDVTNGCVVHVQDQSVFNGDIDATNAFMEVRRGTYNGQVHLHGGTYLLALLDATQAVTGGADYETIVQMNRSKPDTFGIGGGCTFLTPGVK